MKMTMMISLVFGCLTFSANSLSESGLNNIVETKSQNQSSEKSSRRKKVLMCQECGKPETECDCEGHGEEVEHHDENVKEKE